MEPLDSANAALGGNLKWKKSKGSFTVGIADKAPLLAAVARMCCFLLGLYDFDSFTVQKLGSQFEQGWILTTNPPYMT